MSEAGATQKKMARRIGVVVGCIAALLSQLAVHLFVYGGDRFFALRFFAAPAVICGSALLLTGISAAWYYKNQKSCALPIQEGVFPTAFLTGLLVTAIAVGYQSLAIGPPYGAFMLLAMGVSSAPVVLLFSALLGLLAMALFGRRSAKW